MLKIGSNAFSFIFATGLKNYFLLILVLVPNINSENINTKNSDKVNEKNFLIGISEIGVKSENTTNQCKSDLSKVLSSIESRELWALKLIDSFGNVPESISWGNYFWFTSYEYCYDFNDPYKISMEGKIPDILNSTSPMKLKFLMIYYNFTTPIYIDMKYQFEQTIHVGLCLPESCTNDELFIYSDLYFKMKKFEPQNQFDIEMKRIGSKIPEFKLKFFQNIGLLIFGFLLCTVAVFSLLAELINRLNEKRSDAKKQNNLKPLIHMNRFEQFILCFDLRDNIKKALDLEASKDFIAPIAGLRTLVCLWITLFHVFYYSLFTIKNIPLLFAKLENFALQPITQAVFYVDVFFVISAFLLVYNFLSNTHYVNLIKNNNFWGNVILFGKLVLHRYVRLMPVLFATMLLSEIFYDFIDMFSPFRMDQYNGLYCRETWWYNLLLINNFLDLKYICASWSWYLGCEMQYFILFSLILFIYVKNENFGKLIFSAIMILFLIISFCCNYFYGMAFPLDVLYSRVAALYAKPWVRINPYFGGALIGWICYKTKSTTNLQYKISSMSTFWILAASVFLFTIYMSFWRTASVLVVAIIMSLGKLIFGLTFGGIIFMCQRGFGGKFSSLMEWKLFLFLNKLCFCIYMIAPIVVTAVFALRTQSTLFTEMASFMDVLGIMSSTIGFSFLMVVLWEMPFIKISNKFILSK